MDICGKEVFKRVFFEWSKRIQVYLLAKGLNKEESADAVQELFIRIWENCQKYSEQALGSILYTIAYRIFVDKYRKGQIVEKHQASLKNRVNKEDGQFLMEEAEFKTKLELVLNSMTKASQEVFIMSRFNDMSYKEIASHLNISIKAVEKRMSKAISHLVKHNIIKKK